MLTQPTDTRGAAVALAICPAAPLVYLARLWLAFAWITSDYLPTAYATVDAAMTVREIEVSTGALSDNCVVVDLAAWRAERHREADRPRALCDQ
jgi:hypothetical protein